MQLEEIRDKKVLVRLDYNVPIEDGVILNDFRIRQTYNTLNSLLDNNNKLIIASHLGRPTEGLYDESLSLKPICNHLSSKVKCHNSLPLRFVRCSLGFSRSLLIYDVLYKFLSKEDSDNSCLLYTSPSPRDRQKWRMPSSA